MDHFTDEERRFLLRIGEAGLIAFNPRCDKVIARLLDGGFIDAERIDDETAILRLTPEGYAVVARFRDNIG